MEDNIVSSLGNLFTRAFPDVCNNGIKLLLCGDLASGKSMFALRLLLNCLQNCDEFTSFHYKALSTLLVSDHRKLWQRYPLQINVLPKNSTGETNCLLSLRYLNSTWNLQANDDSLTELEEYLNWLDEQGTLEANDGGALIPCFETVVQLNVTANSPNILKLTMLELPALIADSSPSKQVCCIHEINTCTQIDSNTKLVSKVIEYNNVEDFIMSYLQDRDHYIPLIFEHNEEANSKFIQLFKLACAAYQSKHTNQQPLPSFLILPKADFVNISELRKTMKYRLAANERDQIFSHCIVMMNYHCQWEDSPHLIVCEEMNQRLQILLQCEAELLKDLMAKDGVITDWKEVGLRSLLNTFDQLIFTQFSLQFDSIMDRFRLELLGFEEELQEVLPPNPILYCPSSKGQSTPQFDIQQPIAEYLQQIDQVIEMELLRCPLLDFFEGVNPENVLNNFIPCLSGILTKSADSCSLKTTISSHCSSGGDNNNTNDDKHIERNDPKNVESFELLKKRIQFLQQCRERFQDYLTKLKISLREKMFERTNSTLFASTQNRSRKSFHQLHRFPALIAYLKHDVMDKFIEQNFPELITEIMQYFDWTMMQLEAEGKLTLFKLTVELSEQFTFLTKQSVLKQWMQLLEAFKSSNAKYMVDHSHIRMLLEEQVGYRKTREQCYYRLYSWHLQLQSLRSLHHYLNEINVITTGMAFEQLKDIQQEEIRQLLNKAIRKRKSKLHDFQRRWNASAMVIEEWEPDFWEIAWRKFHNLPAEDIKISSSRSDTDDETMEVSNSKLKDGERKETKEIKINPSKILVGDLQMSLAKQMNVSNYSPQGYNSSKKPRLI